MASGVGLVVISEGAENIAEDGVPILLVAMLANKEGVLAFEAFDTPVGMSDTRAIGPGGDHQFSFPQKMVIIFPWQLCSFEVGIGFVPFHPKV